MLKVQAGTILSTGRVKIYPGGSREILVCDRAIFKPSGWEDHKPKGKPSGKRKAPADGGGDVARAVRRARSQVRDIALCNPMTWFVTLTLDGARVDRYDMAAVTRKLNAWLSNQVQRKGLKYVLVPELHKDGAIHFHGFFSDALEAVDSGTMIPPEGGKPKRPRSKAQAQQWAEQGGRKVYNLPAWTLGFTTAIALYGDYENAVGYVCKYIGKDQGAEGQGPDGPEPAAKIGGRWYYSGGDLARPEVVYADLDFYDVAAQPGAYQFTVPEAGRAFVLLREKGG